MQRTGTLVPVGRPIADVIEARTKIHMHSSYSVFDLTGLGGRCVTELRSKTRLPERDRRCSHRLIQFHLNENALQVQASFPSTS
jgi:hypothetical protein